MNAFKKLVFYSHQDREIGQVRYSKRNLSLLRGFLNVSIAYCKRVKD